MRFHYLVSTCCRLHLPAPPVARFLVTVCLFFSALATRGQGSWTSAFQSDPSYLAYTRKVVIDSLTGDTWVTGSYSGTLVLGTHTLTSAGNTDVFVARRSAAGQWLWALSAGSPAPEDARGLALDAAGNAYVCGGYYGPAVFGSTTLAPPSVDRVTYVARISPQGQWQWVQHLPGPSNLALNLTCGPAGHVVVGGMFMNHIVLGADTLRVPNGVTSNYGFIGQLDPTTGQWEWAARADGMAMDMGVDATGAAYVCGRFFDSATFGSTTLTGAPGVMTGYLARLSPTGQWRWAQAIGGTQDNQLNTLALAPNGAGAYVGGLFMGTAMVAGQPLTSAGEFDMLVLSVDSAGTIAHAARAGGPGADGVTDLSPLPGGRVVMAGRFAQQFQLGPSLVVSAGFSDILLAVWQPDSAQSWSQILTAGGDGYDTVLSAAALALPSGLTRLEVGGDFQSSSLAFGPTVLYILPSLVSPLFLATWNGQITGLGEESRALRLGLAPNPAHHTVRITGAPAGPITVLDALGREVRSANLPPSTSDRSPLTADLDLTGLPPGLYLVRAGTQTRRLMVE